MMEIAWATSYYKSHILLETERMQLGMGNTAAASLEAMLARARTAPLTRHAPRLLHVPVRAGLEGSNGHG